MIFMNFLYQYASFRFIDTNILVTGRFEKKAASLGQGELD